MHVYVDRGRAKPGMHGPEGDSYLVNEVNFKRRLPIGSKPSLASGEDVTANMSQPRDNSRERAESCFSIHSYSLREAEPNLYRSVSSAAPPPEQKGSPIGRTRKGRKQRE